MTVDILSIWLLRSYAVQLTNEQSAFLEEQGISLGSVFDAGGVLRRREYRREMKALGKIVAVGVRPCARGKHQMRTRSGHCAMCEPDVLRYQERWWEKAFIYIAGSLSARILKVGFATDVTSRIISLNVEGYAGISDWEALYWVETKNAGQKEYCAHLHLRDHTCPRRYTKAGREVNCLETFACNANAAISAVRSVADPLIEEWINRREIQRYQFKSVSGGRFARKKVDTGKVRAKGSPSRNKRTPQHATVIHTKRAEEVAAPNQTVRKPQAAVRANALQAKSSTAQFHGFTARCPACGRLNRISASSAHLKPMCGARECRASLVGLLTR